MKGKEVESGWHLWNASNDFPTLADSEAHIGEGGGVETLPLKVRAQPGSFLFWRRCGGSKAGKGRKHK
jgi:hypothetical protein